MSVRTIAIYGEPKCGKTDVAIALGGEHAHYVTFDERSVADTAAGMGLTLENIHVCADLKSVAKTVTSVPDDALLVIDEMSLIFKMKLGALSKEHSDNGMKMYPAVERAVIGIMKLIRKRSGTTVMTLWEQNPKEQKLTSGDTKIIIGKPGIPGVSAANTFSGMCDLILRVQAQTGSDVDIWPWEFQVTPNEMYMAGGRGLEGWPSTLPLSLRAVCRALDSESPELFEGHNELIDALAPMLGNAANKSKASKLIESSKMDNKTLRVVLADAKCTAALSNLGPAHANALMAGVF